MAESAPSFSKPSVSANLSFEKRKEYVTTNEEIVTRAAHIASIMRAIECMIDELPDSSRTAVRLSIDWTVFANSTVGF